VERLNTGLAKEELELEEESAKLTSSIKNSPMFLN
jgi:hypothetical protein